MASAGRVLLIMKDDWESGSDYNILDVVYDGGSSFVAKQDIVNSSVRPENDATNWQILARGHGDGDSGYNVLKRTKRYAVGDVAYSTSAPSWVQLVCITAGTTAPSEPAAYASAEAGDEITDGTAIFAVYNASMKHVDEEITRRGGGSTLRIVVEEESLQDCEVHIADGYDTVTGILYGERTDVMIGAMTGKLTVTAIDKNGKTARTTVTVTSYATYTVRLRTYKMFGFHYSQNNSDPASVTYLSDCDNASFTPMTMNLTSGVPNYGDWSLTDEDTRWLFPRSCMVKYDGTVDYYLDENDETKKENGTASDVANSNYPGNAMMEWGRDGKMIWWKVVPDADGKGFKFYVANAQVDADFHAWNHYDCKGNLAPHFYTAKYFGSHDGTRIRSISGLANYVNTAGTNEIAKAKANNQGTDELWNIENWCDRFLVWMLLCMLGKNMNTQAVFGQGRCASGNTSAVANNTLNGKGLFCGFSNQTSDVKVFGMQGWWGNLWRRCNGLINANGTIKIKLTYTQVDGSTVTGYNTDGSGYINHGTVVGNTSGAQVNEMNITDKGLTPKTLSGGDQTYYADGCWTNNGQVNFALVGGYWGHGARVGAACVSLSSAVSDADSNVGAALSCKPLAA